MKRFLFIAIPFLVFSLSVFAPVYAHDVLGNQDSAHVRLEMLREKRQEKLDQLANERQEKLQKLQQKKDELREKIATKQAELRTRTVSRIKEVFLKILQRMETALGRLDKVADRIATRIDKLKAEGVDTTAAETQLAEAEQLGSDAGAAIDSAQGAVEAIDPDSSTVRDAVMSAKEAIMGAKQALKNYHKALMETVRELKLAKDSGEGSDSD